MRERYIYAMNGGRANTHYETGKRPEREEIDLFEEHSELKKNRSQKRNRKDKDYEKKYGEEHDDWN